MSFPTINSFSFPFFILLIPLNHPAKVRVCYKYLPVLYSIKALEQSHQSKLFPNYVFNPWMKR